MLKNFLIFLVLAIGPSLQAQSTYKPYPATCTGALFGTPCQVIYTFDNAYWLSQPVPVQNLWALSPSLDPSSPRNTLAIQLMLQGYTIDVPIQVWGWDAYLAMQARQADGLVWVPSAGQAPGGGTSLPVPSGAIKVSTNPADFPPLVPPPAPVNSPSGCASAVAGDLGFQINGLEAYAGKASLTYPAGTTCEANGSSFVADLLGSDLMAPTQRVEVWLKQN